MLPQRRNRSPLHALCASAVLCVAFASAAPGEVITITHPHWDLNQGDVSIAMDFRFVGDIGNAADTTGYGRVDHNYRIGTYGVSVDQWNIVSDAIQGGLGRSAAGHSSHFSESREPVNQVTWYQAALFANWLTSGDKNVGAYDTRSAVNWGHADASQYTGATVRNSSEMSALLATYDRVYVLPTENEWYKAAYYDPNRYGAGDSGYWLYPTRQTDTAPTAIPQGTGGGTEDYTAVFGRGSWGGGGLPDDHDRAGGLSAYGTIAQGGNMGEWAESIDTTTTENRVYRSSSFSPGVTALRSTSRSHWHPHRTNSHVGLRVGMLQYQATQWTGGTDDSWQTADNWTDGVPTAGDLVVFNSSGIYPPDAATPLTLDGTVDVYGIMVGDGANHLGQVDFGVTDRILASGGLIRLGAGGLTATMLNVDPNLTPDEARFVSIRSDIELTTDTFIHRIGNFGVGSRNRTLIIDGVISGGTPANPVHLIVNNDGAGSPNRAVRFTSSNTFVGEMALSGTIIMDRGDGFGDPSNPVRFGNSMYLLMSAPGSATTANPIVLSSTANVLINRTTGTDWTLTGDITGGAGNHTMELTSGIRRIIFAGGEQSFANRVDLWGGTRVVIAAADENGIAWPNAGRIRFNSSASTNAMGHVLLQGDFTLAPDIEVRNLGVSSSRQARLGQLNDGTTPFDAVFNGSIDVQETSFRALELTADAGGSATFTGPIRVAGGYGFVKLGAGTVAVNNRVSREFSTLDPIGQVVVQQGTLLVNSPTADPFATTEILVSPGAVLGGGGHIAGDVTLDGTSANPATLTPTGALAVSGDVALGASPAGSVGTIHLTGGSLAVGGSVTGGAGLRTVHVDHGTMTVVGNLAVDALRVGHQEGTAALSTGGVVEIGDASTRPDLLIANTTLTGASGNLKTVIGTLDLSGASQFNAYLGELVVGRATQAHARATGTLKLAETNHIDAETITIADIWHFQGGGGTSSMVLGETNTFVTDLLTVGGDRGLGSMAFADGIADATLTLADSSGDGAGLRIGYTDGNTTTAGHGTMDLSGGTFNATLGDVVIGYRLARSSTGGDSGLLIFEDGSVDADSLLLGSVGWCSTYGQSGGLGSEAQVTGELDMRGGTFAIDGDVVAGVGRADAGLSTRTHLNNAHGEGTIKLSGGTFSAGSMTLGIGEEDPTGEGRWARGTGTLDISGGTAAIGGNITLATGHADSVGTINLTGGTLAAGSITKGDKGTAVFDFTGGTLHVGTFGAPGAPGAPGAAFDLEQKGGTLAPGTSIGTTTIYGDYLQSGGTLEIEIAGADEHDFVMVYGDATLEGYLDVRLLDGFAPSVGQYFDVLQTAGDLTVDFADVSIGPAELAFGWWEVASMPYAGGDGYVLRLSAVPEPTTAMLGLLALAGLLGCVRPRRR